MIRDRAADIASAANQQNPHMNPLPVASGF
jgi:hypothetical protein